MVPVREMLVTDAPDSTRERQTREPTKPVPPTTAIFGPPVEEDDIMEMEVEVEVVVVHAVVWEMMV